MRVHYFLLLFLFPLAAAAQENRILVTGSIEVPEGFDSEGIHIYNKTAKLGTISAKGGEFQLKMKQEDTLHFSGIQFEVLEIVVDANTISSAVLQVEIREGLNELPEIVIRPHDLTGNLAEDSRKIEVFVPGIPPLPPTLNTPTGATTTRNSVVNEIGGGANHLLLLVKGIKALFPKRKKDPAPPQFSRIEKEKEIRASFDDDFFVDHLDLQPEEISDFVSFSIEENFDSRLLQENHRMELIQYLMEKREQFTQTD